MSASSNFGLSLPISVRNGRMRAGSPEIEEFGMEWREEKLWVAYRYEGQRVI
jgi:hypothetical protein